MAQKPAETPTPIAEIDHGPSQFEQFMDKHQKKLILGAVLIALGVIGYVVYSGIEQGKQQSAGAALVKAKDAAALQDVIKNHPNSNAAASAMPLLANAQWQESQPDTLTTLNDFIAQHPDHPAALTAKANLGLRLLDQGKLDEAKEALLDIADNHSESYIAPLACIALGDIAKAEKKVSEARQWYEKARSSDNYYRALVTQRLAIVSAEAPVKIQPAPPAPPKPKEGETEGKKADNPPVSPDTPAGNDNQAPPSPDQDTPAAPKDQPADNTPSDKQQPAPDKPQDPAKKKPEPTL